MNALAAPGSRCKTPCASPAVAERIGPFRVHGDERGDRRRPAAPLRRRVLRGERVLDLRAQLGDPGREEAARDRDVTPDERLAIAQQPTPRLLHRVAREHAQRVRVPLRRTLRGLARRALE